MTLHPCPDDFFQDFVLMPFQSSSLSSLSDSSLSSLGGHRCIDVVLALHCQCLLRCPDVLTEIYHPCHHYQIRPCHHWEVTDALTLHWLCIVNASSGVLMSSPRYISKISINPNDTTLHYFLQFVFKFNSSQI